MSKRVLIVGASRGIGLELVRQYRADGDEVVGTARDESGLAAVRALGAHPLQLDVTVGDVVFGGSQRFDTVVYCAGVYGPRTTAPEAPTQADFDSVMHTNVYGPMRVLPALAGRLAGGARLAVLSSRMGSIGERAGANGWLYRASKAAVNSVIKDLSITLTGRAICVALHPGWVRTDMGGSGADLTVADSAAGLRRTLAVLKAADNGGFFNYDGSKIGW